MGGNLRAALTLLPRRRPRSLPTASARRSVTVSPDHLAAYARICGFPISDELPATYPHVLAFPLAMRLMSAPDFPFPVVGIVHVANRITVRRPLSSFPDLDLSVRAADLRAHPRGRQFDVIASATADGSEVWTGVSTYLRKERPSSQTRERAAAPDPTASWRVPARIGRDYAAVSGDHNPIHTSRVGARLFGFPRPIAHGMWSLARCLSALAGRLPPRYAVSADFQRPILLPSTVDFAAAPVEGGWEFGIDTHLAGRVHPL